jgi:DinB superfamily
MNAIPLVVIPALLLSSQAGAPFKASTSPVSDALRTSLTSASTNLVGATELMPADKYAFHPTPAQMTFGQLVVHIAQTNFALCSGVSGTPAPVTVGDMQKMSATDTKDALVRSIRQSFDYCGEALAKVDDSRLSEQITMFGRDAGLSRGAAIVVLASDWADHYSTAASYLRLNDILPPSAQPKK